MSRARKRLDDSRGPWLRALAGRTRVADAPGWLVFVPKRHPRRARRTLMLRFLGGLCAVAGFLAWVGLLWSASTSLQDVTPESEEGGRLLRWGLAGTLLMIGGMILLHIAADAAEREEDRRRD